METPGRSFFSEVPHGESDGLALFLTYLALGLDGGLMEDVLISKMLCSTAIKLYSVY